MYPKPPRHSKAAPGADRVRAAAGPESAFQHKIDILPKRHVTKTRIERQKNRLGHRDCLAMFPRGRCTMLRLLNSPPESESGFLLAID